MSRGMKIGLIIGVIVIGAGGLIAAAAAKRRNKAVEVRLEQVGRRDLVAAVTASGKLEADKQVDVSADVTGRITHIAVKEGDRVKKGQFLVQIDPVQFEGAVSRGEAALASNEAAVLQAKANRDQAKRTLDRSLEIKRTAPELIAPEAVEQAQQAYDVAVSVYQSNMAQVDQARASLKEARDNLARTRLFAPISGRVVRLPVEEGEVAVPGTFSKETALLMTIADLSTILAKVQVDETDVVRLHLEDSVAVSIDAYPDTTFLGRVTKIGNSAKLDNSQATGGSNPGTNDRAVDFDVEVTLKNPPQDVRPDLSCTARIVTDTRPRALSIPIIALTVRENEKVPNEAGPEGPDTMRTRKFRKKETEGVFVVRDGIASFRPVKVGIAGDEYFEVLDGVREGETIVAGTYQAIRDLKDSTRVKQAPEPKKESKVS
ncbi:MAG TPA: efflux RND transporter periplasmic adaptor subunit [Gemmatimonadales bacterium]|nr:efflux RND transporter periplasmic adaptor subunit [Gemmatimonadales bacterium]